MTARRPPPPTARQSGAELAAWLAVRAQGGGEPAGLDAAAEAQRLRERLAVLASDPREVERFFDTLGRELRRRGAQLPVPLLTALPPELQPLLRTLDEALVGEMDDIDAEALAARLDAELGHILGEAPRAAGERLGAERARRRAGTQVAASLRRHGLAPEGTPPADDDFWQIVGVARGDRAAFLNRLESLPRERLRDFHWELAAARLEQRRTGQPPDEPLPDEALDAEPARVYRQRFGEPLAPGL